MMSVLASEEEKFAGCRNFVFRCPGSGEEIVFKQGVFTVTVSHDYLTIDSEVVVQVGRKETDRRP